MTEDCERPGVGEELASARVSLGLSIADVAQQLKFAVRQIEAMEQERFEALPSGTFARGMVRSYARLLKLEAEPLVNRMAARVVAPDNAEAVIRSRGRIPITDNARRSNLIYGALSLAILGVIAAVVLEWQRERSAAARLSFVAAAQAPLDASPAPAAQVQAQVQAQAQAASDAQAEAVTAQYLSPLASADASRTAEVRPVAGGAAAGMRRIFIKFEGDSWVEIRGHDGKILTSGLNQLGSEKTIEGKPPFLLVIGNAQHVRLSYDEQPVDLSPHVKVEVARFTLD